MERAKHWKNQMPCKVMGLLLAFIAVLSAVMTVTFAWSHGLNKINEFIGIQPKNYAVTLQKYEKDIDGKQTAIPLKGTEFYLYQEDGEDTFQIGGRYLTDENGQVIITRLPVGSYYFLETNPTYAYIYDQDTEGDITCYPFTIGQDTDSTQMLMVTAYNQRRHARLTLSKIVENADGTELKPEQKEQLFEFTVTFSDAGSYVYKVGGKEHTLESGGTLKLCHRQTAVFEKLPVGVQYTIAETRTKGYITTSTNSQGSILTEGAKATFVNIYDESQNGSLTISKQVSGEGADPEKEFKFTVTFSEAGTYRYRINGGTEQSLKSGETLTLRGAETAVFANLPIDLNFTVIEEDPNSDGYTATVETVEGTIIRGGTEVKFHNRTSHSGSGALKISKQVTGAKEDPEKEFTFTVTFSDNGTYDYKINGGNTRKLKSGGKITLKHGETAEFSELPSGIDYSVSEDNHSTDGYTAAIWNVTGKIAGGAVSEATFINYKKETLLTVKKLVKGEIPAADTEKEFHFTVIIDAKITEFALKADEEKQFPLPIGASYEVIEKDPFPDNYIQTSVINGSGIADKQPVECTVTNTIATEAISISGQKTWDISAAPETTLPESITVLLKNESKTVEVQTVRPDSTGIWDYTFIVPKYDEQGNEIPYTIDETEIAGYEKTVSGYNIKNTYISDTRINLSAEKILIGTPEENARFTFRLTRLTPSAPMPAGTTNGRKTAAVSGSGTADFGEIIFDTVGEYVYRIIEEKGNTKGYTYDTTVYKAIVRVSIEGTQKKAKVTYEKQDGSKADALVFTNTYKTPSITDVKVSKVWIGDAVDHPSSINVQLYKDGTAYGEPITLSEANGWTYIWAGLDDTAAWTVDEPNVPEGYTKLITGDMASGFVIHNTSDEDNLDKLKEKITISGTKIWNHGDNPQANRPKSITIYIKNGETVAAMKQVTAADHWQWAFKLPRYNTDGSEIQYTADEAAIDGYTKHIDGYDITNTHSSFKTDKEKVTISGRKTWEHGNIDTSKKPSSIYLYVKNGSKTVVEKEVTAADNWSWSITLPKYEADSLTPITYTISEGSVPYYTATVNGYNITNTFKGYGYPGDSPGGSSGKSSGTSGTNPKTGDSNPILLWITILTASALLLVILWIIGRRSKNRQVR